MCQIEYQCVWNLSVLFYIFFLMTNCLFDLQLWRTNLIREFKYLFDEYQCVSECLLGESSWCFLIFIEELFIRFIIVVNKLDS